MYAHMMKSTPLAITAIVASSSLLTLISADSTSTSNSNTNIVPVQWSDVEANAYKANAKLHSSNVKNRRWMAGDDHLFSGGDHHSSSGSKDAEAAPGVNIGAGADTKQPQPQPHHVRDIVAQMAGFARWVADVGHNKDDSEHSDGNYADEGVVYNNGDSDSDGKTSIAYRRDVDHTQDTDTEATASPPVSGSYIGKASPAPPAKSTTDAGPVTVAVSGSHIGEASPIPEKSVDTSILFKDDSSSHDSQPSSTRSKIIYDASVSSVHVEFTRSRSRHSTTTTAQNTAISDSSSCDTRMQQSSVPGWSVTGSIAATETGANTAVTQTQKLDGGNGDETRQTQDTTSVLPSDSGTSSKKSPGPLTKRAGGGDTTAAAYSSGIHYKSQSQAKVSKEQQSPAVAAAAAAVGGGYSGSSPLKMKTKTKLQTKTEITTARTITSANENIDTEAATMHDESTGGDHKDDAE